MQPKQQPQQRAKPAKGQVWLTRGGYTVTLTAVDPKANPAILGYQLMFGGRCVTMSWKYDGTNEQEGNDLLTHIPHIRRTATGLTIRAVTDA